MVWNTKHHRRRDLKPRSTWIIELEPSSVCVKHFVLFHPAALPPHKDGRPVTRAHKKQNSIFIWILIFLKVTVFSDYHLSSAQCWRCSVENYSVILIAVMANGQPRGAIWPARRIYWLGARSLQQCRLHSCARKISSESQQHCHYIWICPQQGGKEINNMPELDWLTHGHQSSCGGEGPAE